MQSIQTIVIKRMSLVLAAIASLFVVQSSMFIHKPEVPEELLK
jgi:cyclic lactone autoinducer peptide